MYVLQYVLFISVFSIKSAAGAISRGKSLFIFSAEEKGGNVYSHDVDRMSNLEATTMIASGSPRKNGKSEMHHTEKMSLFHA